VCGGKGWLANSFRGVALQCLLGDDPRASVVLRNFRPRQSGLFCLVKIRWRDGVVSGAVILYWESW